MSQSATAETEVIVWVAGEPGQTTVYEALANTFNAENPDVKLTVVNNSSDLFNPALIPALSAGEGPDLFTFGTGPGQPAALIDGGLVADLTDDFYELSWNETIPEGIISQTSSNGKLWSFGNEVETTGMPPNCPFCPSRRTRFQATVFPALIYAIGFLDQTGTLLAEVCETECRIAGEQASQSAGRSLPVNAPLSRWPFGPMLRAGHGAGHTPTVRSVAQGAIGQIERLTRAVIVRFVAKSGHGLVTFAGLVGAAIHQIGGDRKPIFMVD